MTSKTQILLIDDDDDHSAQIKKNFPPEFYELKRLPNLDDIEEIYKFKATHPRCQIMVIDYDLGEEKDGLDLIKNELWLLDRHAFLFCLVKHLF